MKEGIIKLASNARAKYSAHSNRLDKGAILKQVYIDSSLKAKLSKRNYSLQPSNRSAKNNQNPNFRKKKYTAADSSLSQYGECDYFNQSHLLESKDYSISSIDHQDNQIYSYKSMGHMRPNERDSDSKENVNYSTTQLENELNRSSKFAKPDASLDLMMMNCMEPRPPISKKSYNSFHHHRKQQQLDPKQAKALEFINTGKKYMDMSNYPVAIHNFSLAYKYDSGCLEALYYRGIAYIRIADSNLAIDDFTNVVKANPNFKKRYVYILLAEQLCKVNKPNEAIAVLSKAISLYEDMLEALLARGQLYSKCKKVDLAIKDFLFIIKIRPNCVYAYIGVGSIYEEQLNYSLALQNYNKSLKLCEGVQMYEVLLRRGICLYRMKSYDESFKDLSLCMSKMKPNYEVCLHMGKLSAKKLDLTNAILYFEQAASFDMRTPKAGYAIYKLANLQLKCKDFYDAHYHFKRALFFGHSSQKLQMYLDFTDGAIFLMKKKTKKGVAIISKLIENKQYFKCKAYVAMLFAMRAYGLMVRHQFVKAFEDIQVFLSSTDEQNDSVWFNKCICQGIMCIAEGKLDLSFSFFNKAGEKFTENKECFIYRAISYVKMFIGCHNDKYLHSAIKEIDSAIKFTDKDPFLHFYRGIMRTRVGQYFQALKDYEKTIKYADESTAVHYYMRGLCYGCMNLYKQAIEDFSVAIKLNENMTDAYLLRGRCSYLIGDSNQAFIDYQQLISKYTKDPIMHIHAGNLLMVTSSYKDAAKAYANANEFKETAHSYIQIAKCMMALSDLEKAISALDMASKICPSPNIQFDQKCLQLLATLSTKVEKSQLEEAFLQINRLIEVCTETVHKQSDTIAQFEKYYNKTDVNVLKKADDSHKIKLTINNNNDNEQVQEEDKELKSALFTKEDLVIYRAVINLYLGNYKESLSDLKKILGGDRKKASIEEDAFKSQRSEATAIDSCCSNASEILYNMMLCSLLVNDLASAGSYCDSVISSIQQYQRPLAHYIKSKILSEQGNKKKANEEYFEFMKEQNQSLIKSIKQTNCPMIDIFSIENKLSGLFPYIEVKIGENVKIKLRPSFSLPRPRPPNIIPKADDKILDELDPLKVPCNPEAPWIKREDNIIRFTDEISPYEYNDDEKAKSREEKSESETEVKLTENEANNEKQLDSDTKNGPSELKISMSQKIGLSESSNLL